MLISQLDENERDEDDIAEKDLIEEGDEPREVLPQRHPSGGEKEDRENEADGENDDNESVKSSLTYR